MNNELTQEELEHEIAELESKLTYKKNVLKRFESVNENGRYFLCSDGTISELIPTINNEIWENSIKQGNTFKAVKDAEKERDRQLAGKAVDLEEQFFVKTIGNASYWK